MGAEFSLVSNEISGMDSSPAKGKGDDSEMKLYSISLAWISISGSFSSAPSASRIGEDESSLSSAISILSISANNLNPRNRRTLIWSSQNALELVMKISKSSKASSS